MRTTSRGQTDKTHKQTTDTGHREPWKRGKTRLPSKAAAAAAARRLSTQYHSVFCLTAMHIFITNATLQPENHELTVFFVDVCVNTHMFSTTHLCLSISCVCVCLCGTTGIYLHACGAHRRHKLRHKTARSQRTFTLHFSLALSLSM